MSKAAELAALIGSQSALSNRNLIINGACVIDQRNAGASVTPNLLAYPVDRIFGFGSVTGKFSCQQNSGSVTPPVGFSNYIGAVSLSAYSVGSAEQYIFGQPIEGLNVTHLEWGTSSAATVTLSFYVRSSLTGTFGGSLQNSAFDRSYPFSYTISTANTWERKTITIVGDTSGTWLKTNGVGIRVGFSLGAGSSVSGTAGAWASGNFVSATGATSVVGTNAATLYITGISLEIGEQATPFEHRSFGDELKQCERYYEKTYEYGTVAGTPESYPTNMGMRMNGFDLASGQRYMVFRLRTEKRARPTNTYYGHLGNSGKISTADAGGTLTERNLGLSVTSTSMVGGGSSNGAYAGLMLYVVSDAEL